MPRIFTIPLVICSKYRGGGVAGTTASDGQYVKGSTQAISANTWFNFVYDGTNDDVPSWLAVDDSRFTVTGTGLLEVWTTLAPLSSGGQNMSRIRLDASPYDTTTPHEATYVINRSPTAVLAYVNHTAIQVDTSITFEISGYTQYGGNLRASGHNKAILVFSETG